MLNRLIRLTLVSVFATAVAGYGVAYGDSHEGGGDDNPCGGDTANPCGGDTGDDSGGGDDAGGGDKADDGGGDAAGEGGGDAMGGGEGGGKAPGMILPKGKLAVNVMLGVSLSADAVAKPISINPDVKYGVAPKLDVGVYHSPMGVTGFWAGAGGGICVTGEDNGCAKAFDGPTAILANYSLGEGKLSLAANGGISLNSFDPMMLAIKAGVIGRYMVNEKIAVNFAPNLFLGVTERDAGNKEILNVPVSFGYMVNEKLHAGVQTGIWGPLDGFGDFFMVPVNLGAMYMVSDKLGVAGAFGFTNLLGKNSSADGRALSIYAMWHN
jgi:hypothetical protein